ncbi:MAG: DUF4239 domain-containing protein [Rhizobiaceae bacterium]|nr:DUF4239 domain-containing protein [Rhizobiaceae bacterium]
MTAGMVLRNYLPDHHLNTDSKDAIRLATVIVGTLSALALGLLIASAKTTYDNADLELRTSAARIVLLDRVMAHYGPETTTARQQLAKVVERRLRRGWTAATADEAAGGEAEFQDIELVQSNLRDLVPTNDIQRSLQSRALEVSGMVAEGHWLLVESANTGLPWPFLTILVLWLALLFATFGLQAPPNPTVICILAVCALSVATAIFLITEMADPYQGLLHISDEPLREALGRLGQGDATQATFTK